MLNQFSPMFSNNAFGAEQARADRATKLAQLLDAQSYRPLDKIEMGNTTMPNTASLGGALNFSKFLKGLKKKKDDPTDPEAAKTTGEMPDEGIDSDGLAIGNDIAGL